MLSFKGDLKVSSGPPAKDVLEELEDEYGEGRAAAVLSLSWSLQWFMPLLIRCTQGPISRRM